MSEGGWYDVIQEHSGLVCGALSTGRWMCGWNRDPNVDKCKYEWRHEATAYCIVDLLKLQLVISWGALEQTIKLSVARGAPKLTAPTQDQHSMTYRNNG